MKKFIPATLAVALAAMGFTPSSNAAEDYTKLFQQVARGDQSSESVYFVMTDRFENGDSSNDQGGLTGSSSTTGYDPSDIGYWHGGDFKGLTSRLSYIKDLGFTAIWITPPVVQQYVQGGSAAYHGYWGRDFMHVDPHLGTDADFKNFVIASHKLGMKVILDVVANHTADVIAYNGAKPYIPAGKENYKNPAFLNNINNYHNLGPSTFEGESALVGDFNSLDDIATEKPEVVQGFINIWSYWITEFDIDGFRIDTFKHVNPEFWRQVIPAVIKVAAKSGKKSFPIFGEVFDTDPQTLATYVAGGQVSSVLDFGFNEQVTRFVANYGTADRLVKLFNSDDLYTSQNTSAYGLATFLGNHDMGRIGSTIYNSAPDKESALKHDILAQSVLFLLRGGPVLYYGDEKGMTGGGGDKLARQDMFATQVSSWKYEQRIGSAPVGDGNSFDLANPVADAIKSLQALVAASPALRSGTQQTLAAQGQVFVVSRYANKQEYVVAFNASDAEKSIAVKPLSGASSWSTLAGNCTSSATLNLVIAPSSYCVLKSNSLVAKSATTKVSAPKISSSNDSPLWPQVSVTVNAPGYNSVTFLAREKGGKWKSLGTADRTTFETEVTTGNLYRTFLHPELFKKNAPLEFIAVLKNSDGKIIASTITKGKNG